MTENDFEYFEGVKTIQHADGSTTYVHTTHEPYVDPLTPKEQLAVIGTAIVAVVGICALPFGLVRLEEWSQKRAEVRDLKHQKKLKNMQSEKTD